MYMKNLFIAEATIEKQNVNERQTRTLLPF